MEKKRLWNLDISVILIKFVTEAQVISGHFLWIGCRAEGESVSDGLGPEARLHQLAAQRLADAQRVRPRPHLLRPAGRARHRGQSDRGGGAARTRRYVCLLLLLFNSGSVRSPQRCRRSPQSIKSLRARSCRGKTSRRWRSGCWTEGIGSTSFCRRNPSRASTSICSPCRATSATGTSVYRAEPFGFSHYGSCKRKQ